jgi:hypothetical protein
MDAGRFRGVRQSVVRAGNHWRPPVAPGNKGTGTLPLIRSVVTQGEDGRLGKKGPQALLPGFETATADSPRFMLFLLQLTLRAIQVEITK